MSYNNVVGGKLKLKGKALDVKAGSLKKKKKKSKESFEEVLLQLKEKGEAEQGSDAEGNKGSSVNGDEGEQGEGGSERQLASYEDHRTPAEKKYDEQRILLETRRLAKVASKSHRQKIEEFNQYLANLSEHYDIPKTKFQFHLLFIALFESYIASFVFPQNPRVVPLLASIIIRSCGETLEHM
ncbi:hypothetical protein R1sor_018776 [Riccia sorocarpa]|uniref:Protein FAM32A n=1 Tax=Riccia sorocarpa TaxID=122646 RepID=A0ABD3IDZ6_9MARC